MGLSLSISTIKQTGEHFAGVPNNQTSDMPKLIDDQVQQTSFAFELNFYKNNWQFCLMTLGCCFKCSINQILRFGVSSLVGRNFFADWDLKMTVRENTIHFSLMTHSKEK